MYSATAEFHGKTFTDTKAVADIDLTAHNYKDGKCTVCGTADSAYQKSAKSDTVSGKKDTAKAVQTGDMANPVSMDFTADCLCTCICRCGHVP